ncbi:hypothetical protein [Nonomuraea insulae]|uniref:Uncharacterized protein n=1 Tax=Nonomuraea insulae TaxID=1616787 RepID=A0ABW1DG41_9ACTN
MSRVIAVLATLIAAIALPIVTAGPAQAVTFLDCALGTGVILPSPDSQTRLVCFGGRFNGQPVAGLA